LLIFVISLFIFKAVLLFVSSQISAHITTSYEKNTRIELFGATMKSSWSHLSRQKTGYLNQVLTTDVSKSSALLTYISMSLITISNLIIYTLLAFNVSPVIALITVIFGFIVFLIFKPLFYKNKVISKEVNGLYKEMAHYVDEALIGSKAIKSMSLEKQVAKQGSKYFENMKHLTMKMVFLRNSTSALLQPLGLILVVGIFSYFYKTAAFSFASFAVIVYAINKVFGNVQIAQVQLHQISSFVPYLSAIVEYKQKSRNEKEESVGKGDFKFKKSIEFKNVNFSYDAHSTILEDISFLIKKGDIVGIIGPSGSGKTTITDLILRLFGTSEGEILIDGNKIDAIKLSEWRTNIGYVSQDSFLVNDTIGNNIKFYNKNTSQEDIIRSAKMANIYDFIQELPDQFETQVGERGIKLSGGQRQRIVLARVLATNPEILVLDEATSALDNESEVLIQEAINGLKGKVTVISIAHRLSTVMTADNLIVIEKGKIIEKGNPQELLKDKSSYLFRMYNLR